MLFDIINVIWSLRVVKIKLKMIWWDKKSKICLRKFNFCVFLLVYFRYKEEDYKFGFFVLDYIRYFIDSFKMREMEEN